MSVGDAHHPLDVVIPTFRGASRVAEALEPLLPQLLAGDRVYVVDDGSGDGTAEQLRLAHPTITLVARASNGGFATAVNDGIRRGVNPVVAMLNDDCAVEPGWRAAVADALERHPDAGSVACLVVRADAPGVIDSAGLVSGSRGFVQRLQGESRARATSAGWVLGAAGSAAVYRRSMLAEVGEFDESLGSYYEDVDLALRQRLAGWRCWFEPTAVARHVGGASFEHYSERHVRLCVRNQLIVMTTNLPRADLIRMLPGFVVDQARSGASLSLRHKRAGAWFAGLGGYLSSLPRALKTRAARVGGRG